MFNFFNIRDKLGQYLFEKDNPGHVTLSDSNVEAINGEDAATKSDLVAGKTVGGKQVPLNVDADGKLQVGGITVESLTATTVGIDQETENANEVVVKSGSITLSDSLAKETSAEKLIIDATVGGKSLTYAKYGISTKAFITVEGAPLRCWVDGSVPTATYGHLYNIGDQIYLETASEIAKFRAIRSTDTSATIQCTYYL